MLRSGQEFKEGLGDGRTVYIGGERVDDVTTHAAFRDAAQTYAKLFDYKADPTNREKLAYEEDGEFHSMYFLKPRNREDLARRSLAHKTIADQTFGLMGRSPDHVSSFVTAIAMKNASPNSGIIPRMVVAAAMATGRKRLTPLSRIAG